MKTELTLLHLIPSLELGGAERQLAMLAVEQARRGHAVHVAVRRGGKFESSIRSQGVVVHNLGDYRALDPRLFFRIGTLLRQLNPQLVQTWLPQMDIMGGAAALCADVPWIATERTSKDFYIKDGIPLRTLARKKLVPLSSALVANSGGGALMWRGLLPTDAKVFTVGNAIDIADIQSVMASAAMSVPSAPTILVVGRLIASKALDIVLNAISYVPQDVALHVKVIGHGPLRDSLDAYIHDHNLRNRIELIADGETWWSQMSSAAMLVSMSRFEGQPNVVLEAMAGGCPLVISDIPAHREILDDDSALFVPLDHAEKLANAIQSVLFDPVGARNRAARASTHVEGRTASNMAQAYAAIYREAIEGFK